MISIPGTVPIHIHPLFWFLSALIGWILSGSLMGIVTWTLIILFSVLVHEYGHALTALAFGQRSEIFLLGFGGVTKRKGKRLSLGKEFIITLNGPLFGLILAAISYFFWRNSDPKKVYHMSLMILFSVNLFWSLINLFPVYPLDGGKLVSLVFEAIFGLKGVKVYLFISVVLASLVGAFAMVRGEVMLPLIFILFAFESFRAWKQSLGVTQYDQDESLIELFESAKKDYAESRRQEALQKLTTVLAQAKKGLLNLKATQVSAMILNEESRFGEAYELLKGIKNLMEPTLLILYQKLAYIHKNWDEVLEVGGKIFREQPDMFVAIYNAKAAARLGYGKQSVGWLRSALDEGLQDLDEVTISDDFNPIRQFPEFIEMLRSKRGE